MRTLAIDFGSRRVGLAMSDEGGAWATPYEILQVTSPEQATEAVLKVIDREGVRRLVVGLPLNMDGSVGPAARTTALWARDVAEKAEIPLVLVDERLSSFDAEQQLVQRKRGGEHITRNQKKQKLDAIVASNLLQEFLDGKLAPIEMKFGE